MSGTSKRCPLNGFQLSYISFNMVYSFRYCTTGTQSLWDTPEVPPPRFSTQYMFEVVVVTLITYEPIIHTVGGF